MSNIKAIIIDDEPLAHKVILKYAESIPFLDIVGQCYLATEAYPILSTQKIDLIFLDINMPVIQGLDFLRTLQTKPAIILTTAYEEFALEGFELQVVDYLLKPFRLDRFLKAVNVVRANTINVSQSIEHIFIKVDKKQIQIKLSTIQYLESYGNYVKVWIDNEFHLTARTLTSFEVELGEEFYRIHKSFIVQKSYIDYVEGNMMIMKNGNTVTIGKNYRGKVREMF